MGQRLLGRRFFVVETLPKAPYVGAMNDIGVHIGPTPVPASRRDVIMAMGAVFVCAQATEARSEPSINPQAKSAYLIGRWQEAANLALAMPTADNQAFAARALLAGALLNTNRSARLPVVNQALVYAQAALQAKPDHIEGRLQLATALGLQARSMSPTRAFARGLPQRVKRVLDSVARDAPSEAWTYALLGGWHLEGLRIGGAAARAMLGCDLNRGKAAFARALRLDPNEASPPFYFAASLLALSPGDNETEARTLLVRSSQCPDKDAFQTAVKTRASALALALNNEGAEHAARLALGWL
jgi:tetratricopeptide (TPR) repeat protein